MAAITAGICLLCCPAFSQPSTTSSSEVREPKALGDNPSIRVLISESVTSVCITPKAAWQVQSLSGQPLWTLAPERPTTVVLTAGVFRAIAQPSATVRDVDTSGTALGPDAIMLVSATPRATLAMTGWSATSREKRIHQGRIELHPEPAGTFQCVSVLPVEEYLRGVVPQEIGGASPREALCAQAVAARCEAVRALTSRVYAGSHHDICGTVQCQSFSGLTRNTEATDAAISATRGWILTFEGEPLPAYYSSNCGGHTEDIRNVWKDRSSERVYWDAASFDGEGKPSDDLTSEVRLREWITSAPACYCNPKQFKVPDWAAKGFRWTREIKAADLSKWVAETKDIGPVREIRPGRRGCSGRLTEVEFVGDKGALTVSPELAIRRLFRPALKSSAFVVDTKGGTAASPDMFVLSGAGHGHGVGMCQTGAVGMANAGKTFREILLHYYPKAQLEKIY
jgi:stage II sporulation protein D